MGAAEFVIRLNAPADRAAANAWCDQLRSLLSDRPDGIVNCDVSGLIGSATDVVDALARLRLAAHCSGGRVRFLHADTALCDLLEILGLADLLTESSRPS